MGLDLTEHHVAVLEGRTEGWIAALQLAALSMQGRSDVADFMAGFSGDDRYIVDFLVEEVLQRQPSQILACEIDGAWCRRDVVIRGGQIALRLHGHGVVAVDRTADDDARRESRDRGFGTDADVAVDGRRAGNRRCVGNRRSCQDAEVLRGAERDLRGGRCRYEKKKLRKTDDGQQAEIRWLHGELSFPLAMQRSTTLARPRREYRRVGAQETAGEDILREDLLS